MRLHFFDSAVIANSKMDYSTGRTLFFGVGLDLFFFSWKGYVLHVNMFSDPSYFSNPF